MAPVCQLTAIVGTSGAISLAFFSVRSKLSWQSATHRSYPQSSKPLATETRLSEKPPPRPYAILGLFLFFGIPCLLIGIGWSSTLIQRLYDGVRMQYWVEAECEIVSAELTEELHDELDQYLVEASYRYIWQDRAYLGKRVSLMESPDNDREFNKKLIADLEEHRISRLPYRCFVNPEHPNEAVLIRTARWAPLTVKILAAIAFMGFGLLFVALAKSLWSTKQYATLEDNMQDDTQVDELGDMLSDELFDLQADTGPAVVRKESPADLTLKRFEVFKSIGMQIELLESNGVRLTIPRGRNVIFCLAMLITQAIIFGVLIVAAFFFWKAGWQYIALLLVFWLLASTLNQLLFHSEIEIARGRMSIRNGWFMLGRPLWCASNEFKELAIQADRFFSGISSRYATIRNRVPLGYFVSAQKP